uniref:GDSL esterase/lipase At1g29670-like n=1 Tax=Erigeron canadensis TaxID=72917 RepID=UPI001CB9BCCA|nr:GDSL esterase/lipase At1g29670-like [Erigeron canadensis]
MACKVTLIMCHFLVVVGLMNIPTLILAQPQVPCYFIFGDSLVDSGNNNALLTQAKANYPPYGIDFPEGPTGRFTNGRTKADIIGQLLGFVDNFIPPYATVTNPEISKGVNYGSGGAGIRDETGRNLGDRISLNRQLLNHASIISRLSLLQRNKTFTNEYLKKCIYVLEMGSNDYINNYLMPNNYVTSRIYTPDQYAADLVRQYSKQLRTLYNLGARKVAVFGLSLIGCTPTEIARFGTEGQPCVQRINDAVELFNNKLKPAIDEINTNFQDARFTFINMTSISTPEGGLVPPGPPCCQVRSDGQCVPNSIPCPNRNVTIFYDGFLPTEIVNSLFAARAYVAQSPMDASPYDISQLARL